MFTSAFNSLNDMIPADALGWFFDGGGRRVAAVAATAIRATATKLVIVRCFVMGNLRLPSPRLYVRETAAWFNIRQIR
jgi:hypothetical protein